MSVLGFMTVLLKVIFPFFPPFLDTGIGHFGESSYCCLLLYLLFHDFN